MSYTAECLTFSSWENIGAGLEQVLLIGTLYCLIYIQDSKNFLDDSGLFSVAENASFN